VDTDGSNYSTANPNPAAGGSVPSSYAPAGSGPNGKKTGETFKFNVSSGTAIKGMTFQYCTDAAGLCQAPGNNTGDARDGAATPRKDNDGAGGGWASSTSDLNVVGSFTEASGATPAAGEFAVFVEGAKQPGWTMNAINLEDDSYNNPSGNSDLTGKNNYIRLMNSGGSSVAPGETVQVVFKASENTFITNPGDGSFFVKINTYSTATAENLLASDPSIIDGGVTVANMMTDSIHITTKVLETMDFSVGVRNKDTQSVPHGSCDPIEVLNNNRLDLGNPSAENSLRTDTAYDTNSYWRLSSNSSGGATVYYSGTTLNNTVGDSIAEMGSKKHSQPGTEQFGLALVDPSKATPGGAAETFPGTFPSNWITPSYNPLTIEADYNGGNVASISDTTSTNNAEFAFYGSSATVPEVIAQDSDTVISCATAKVRYVANIAADTPAGVYTTRINYLAAPQY
jgi:hypothetical protein